MANTKVTYAQVINKVLANAEFMATLSQEEADKVKDLLNSVSKKRGESKADKEKAALNEQIMSAILEVLADKGGITVTEILERGKATNPEVFSATISNQKVTYCANQLVADGKVVKVTEKRKVLFSLA